MDSNTYLELSGRTVSSEFFEDNVSFQKFIRLLCHRLDINEWMDDAKKSLFYGRTSRYLGAPDPGKIGWEAYKLKPDLIHGVVGIDTESAELLTLMDMAGRFTEAQFTEEMINELGDLLWYVALVLRTLGLTFEEVMEANIAKLKARYPEGFSQERALNRNEEKESAKV